MAAYHLFAPGGFGQPADADRFRQRALVVGDNMAGLVEEWAAGLPLPVQRLILASNRAALEDCGDRSI